MTDHYKYKKYKTKYLNLKRSNISFDKGFYFMHSTTVFENLLDVLKTGILYPGKYLKPKQRKLCGQEPSDHVYANICFDDIKNIETFRSYMILLHPKIMNENGFCFGKGWGVEPYKMCIKSFDTATEISNKMKIIHDFVQNPESLPEMVRRCPGTSHHEITFDHPINLDDGNLIGIVCEYCENSWNSKDSDIMYLERIKKAIKNKPYAGVKIFLRSTPVPKSTELI